MQFEIAQVLGKPAPYDFSGRDRRPQNDRNHGITIFSHTEMTFLGPPGEVILEQEKPLVERFGPILLPTARQENSISYYVLRHLLDFPFLLSISGSVIL